MALPLRQNILSHTQYVTRLGAWLNISLGVAYCTVMVAMVLIWLIVILINFHFCILNYHLNAEVGHQNNDYHPTLFYFYDLFIQVSIKFSGFCVEWSVTNSSYKLQSQLAVTTCSHNLQLTVAWGYAPGIMQQ